MNSRHKHGSSIASNKSIVAAEQTCLGTANIDVVSGQEGYGVRAQVHNHYRGKQTVRERVRGSRPYWYACITAKTRQRSKDLWVYEETQTHMAAYLWYEQSKKNIVRGEATRVLVWGFEQKRSTYEF